MATLISFFYNLSFCIIFFCLRPIARNDSFFQKIASFFDLAKISLYRKIEVSSCKEQHFVQTCSLQKFFRCFFMILIDIWAFPKCSESSKIETLIIFCFFC